MQLTFSQKFNDFEKSLFNEKLQELEVVQITLDIKPKRTVSLLAKFSGSHLTYRVVEDVERQCITLSKSITSMEIFTAREAADFIFEGWPIAQTLSDYSDGSQTLALTKLSAKSNFYDDIERLANYKLLEFFKTRTRTL